MNEVAYQSDGLLLQVSLKTQIEYGLSDPTKSHRLCEIIECLNLGSKYIRHGLGTATDIQLGGKAMGVKTLFGYSIEAALNIEVKVIGQRTSCLIAGRGWRGD
jgi:hypothetical protein